MDIYATYHGSAGSISSGMAGASNTGAAGNGSLEEGSATNDVPGLDNNPDPCPVATRLAGSVLSLPVHPLLDQKELAYICDTINKVK